jgi:hypothetical protein
MGDGRDAALGKNRSAMIRARRMLLVAVPLVLLAVSVLWPLVLGVILLRWDLVPVPLSDWLVFLGRLPVRLVCSVDWRVVPLRLFSYLAHACQAP